MSSEMHILKTNILFFLYSQINMNIVGQHGTSSGRGRIRTLLTNILQLHKK
jgi:hypothetical protein